MALFTLDKEHPLAKAGVRFVHVVEEVELGLKPGDVVFEFPYGRIVDTGMACRRNGIIPPEIEIIRQVGLGVLFQIHDLNPVRLRAH